MDPVAPSVYVTSVTAFIVGAVVIFAVAWLVDQAWRRAARAWVLFVSSAPRRPAPVARNWRTHP